MFKIFRIRQYIARFFRAIDIIFILLGFAIINWMSTKRYLFRLIPKKYKRNGTLKTQPERLRTVIEELGPTFIKFGQILADRPDIISEKLRGELKKLQSTVEPFDHNTAIARIEEELGGDIKKFFKQFDLKCIGSASIGQVYKGTLLNGEVVVVKIQRPDIEPKIQLDLQILKYLAKELIKEYPGFSAVDIIGLIEEFGDTILKELNYLNEAANAARFADIFKDADYVKIPRAHLELSTDRLLIMEYVDGIPPDDKEALIAAGLDPTQIAINGTTVLLEMIFKNGFFHADPHPGNMFIQENNRIALIDFGMAGSLKAGHMQFLASFILGLATKNATTISESLLTLCDKKFFSEKADLEFMVEDMISRHMTFSYENIHFSQILSESIKIIQKHHLKLPSSIFLLMKALATVEKFGYNLDPDISLPVLIRPYAETLIKEKFSAKQIAGEVYDTLKDYVSLIRDFPSEINEILYRIKQGKITLDINVKEKEIFASGLKQIGGVIAIVLLVGILMAGSVILITRDKEVQGANFMLGASIFFSLWLLLRLFTRTK
jgi:ubiquinone biosynthesis protein